MPSKKSYFVLAIGMSLIWEIIKKSKGTFARAIHEIFCLSVIFAREGIPFEKNELVVRLESSLFLYNHEAC